MLLHICYWEYRSTVEQLISRGHKILMFREKKERPSCSLLLCFVIQSSPVHHPAFSLQATIPPRRWRISPPQLPTGSAVVGFTGHYSSTQASELSYREQDHTNCEPHLKRMHKTRWSQTASSRTCYKFIMGYKIYDPKLPLFSSSPLEDRVPLTCSKQATQCLPLKKIRWIFKGINESQSNSLTSHRSHLTPSNSLVSLPHSTQVGNKNSFPIYPKR